MNRIQFKLPFAPVAAIAAAALLAFAALACTAEPEVVEVVKEVEVIKEVEKEVEVIKEVEVEKEVVKEVVVVATAVPSGMMDDTPVSGGTIRFGMIAFNSLDPMLAGLAQGEAPYGELTYDNIVHYWYDGEVTPWAVESWSSTSDLSEYTFKVREGIKFHSGNTLTSADIKFTLDRIRAPESASPHKENIGYIDTITTPDDNTVVLDLGENSNAFVMGDMTDYHSRIVPNGVTNDEITTGEHGSGAYTLVSHNSTERSVMERYTDYWRENRPYADQMVFFYMPEQVTRIEALKTGAIDVVIGPAYESLGSFAGNPDIRIASAPSAGVNVIDMHTGYAHLQGDDKFAPFQGAEEPLFADKNLRKAMQYAVDRDFVTEAALFGRGSPANDHPVGINDQYYWDDQPIIKQDIAKAKEYLAAAGYADGVDVTLNTSDFNQMLDISEAFKESVAEAGINVDIVVHPQSTYWTAQWMNPCCEFITSSWGARPANASINVQLRGGGVWNESFFNNARLDELLDLAAGEADFDKRKEYFREMQEILIEEVPVLYLAYSPVMYAHRASIGGVQAHTALAHWLFEEWWVKDN